MRPSNTIIALMSVSLLLGGCLPGLGPTEPTKFYLLNSLYTLDPNAQPVARMGDRTIGVGPINMAEYIDRPQIITRSVANEVQLGEFHKWAEPLQNSFFRVLADNLAILLDTDRIVTFPWNRSTFVDYQVAVDVGRFDGNLGNSAMLRARWMIFGDDGRKLLSSKHVTITEPINGSNIEDLVSAQSRILVELSRQIAESIRTLANQ
jgi:uncharacterized lipoprotein YmbA